MKMGPNRIGWCAPLEAAPLVRDLGYDFLEPPLAPFGLEDQASLDRAKAAIAQAPLPVAAFNWFYPRDFRLVGDDVDRARIKSYLKRAAELVQHAGAQAVGLGSGWARNVPDGFSRERARDQILESLGWLADAFAGSGAMIGIEAQNRKEANIINRLAEAVDYAATLNRPDVVRVIADFYHMDEEAEPLEDLARHGDWIVHVQLADTGRLYPGSGAYDYDAFFRNLRAGGYTGTISVECMVPMDQAGMRESEKFLRRLWPREGEG